MASIKNLKKNINLLTYELLTEVFAFKHFHPELSEKKFDDIIMNLVKLRNELISRINNRNKLEGKDQLKQYFRKIQDDMLGLVRVVESLSK